MPAISYNFETITEGFKASFRYKITVDTYQRFLALFSDANPLHIDDAFAVAHGFNAKVMHGSILNGFLSHFVGMHFPGTFSLLQSVHIQYKNACYLEDEILLEAVVSQKVNALKVVVMDVTFLNETRRNKAATAKVQVGLSE